MFLAGHSEVRKTQKQNQRKKNGTKKEVKFLMIIDPSYAPLILFSHFNVYTHPYTCIYNHT